MQRGEPLEAVLRDLADSPYPHIIRQYQQIPLYLQDLFGTISEKYTRRPDNYNILVNQLLSEFTKVAFVTLNYDLLLDRSIANISDLKIKNMDSYIDSNPILVKLHGSINWGRLSNLEFGEKQITYNDEKRNQSFVSDYLQALNQATIKKSDLGPAVLLPSYRHKVYRRKYCYPALVVPVEGKYGFVCPEKHTAVLASFISRCHSGIQGKFGSLSFLSFTLNRCAANTSRPSVFRKSRCRQFLLPVMVS